MLTIRYSLPMQALAVLCGLLAAAAPVLVGVALWLLPRGPGQAAPMVHLAVACVVTTLLGVYALRETRGAYAVFSEEGVEQYSPWFGRTRIPWPEVEEVDVYLNGYVLIRGSRRRAAGFGWYREKRAAIMALIRRQAGPKIKHTAF
jgi:hypothetical protein